MLKLNMRKKKKNMNIMYDLNTSRVKVKLLCCTNILIRLAHLNTSHVKVKRRSNKGRTSNVYNLNTSHVKVKL